MAYTVDNIQAAVAATVDQDEDASNISTTDYSHRLELINQRERSWSEIYDWPSMYSEFNSQTSLATSQATISLPSDFRHLVGYPKITADGTTTNEYTVIRPTESEQYNSSDTYCYVLGNPSSGYSLVVNPATLSSGASIHIAYQSSPASLASPEDSVYCPNPQYLIKGVVADVWEAREDARFPFAKAEADRILQNLVEAEQAPREGQAHRNIRTYEQTRANFRWGRD